MLLLPILFIVVNNIVQHCHRVNTYVLSCRGITNVPTFLCHGRQVTGAYWHRIHNPRWLIAFQLQGELAKHAQLIIFCQAA